MTYKVCLIITVIFILCTSCFAYDASISAKTDCIIATNVPENTDMIVGLYNDNRMIDMKIYHGQDTITADYVQDMTDSLKKATDLKAFLWNMKSLTPLCKAFSVKTNELPKKEKILVVYYSRSNNTKALAETVHGISGGDLIRIEPINPYPENYSDCLAQVRKEQAENYKPPISVDITDISDYDIVLLGYPIWYNSLPTPVVTFLSNYDFSEKKIIPFCTSGSTGISGSVSKLKAICPKSTVSNGFRGSSSSSQLQVREWLKENGFENSQEVD